MRRLLFVLPLLCACEPPQPTRAATPEEIRAMGGMQYDKPLDLTFEATDTMTLHATVMHPEQGPQGKVVILAHQMCQDRAEWSAAEHDWISALRAKGISTFAIDLRGHGQSTAFADGSNHDLCKEINDESVSGLYTNMVMDVRSAVSYVRANMEVKSIAVVGSSIGANSALLAFGTDPELKAVVALSPGMNYRNVQPAPAMAMAKGRNIVLVAAEDDKGSADAVRELAALGENVNATVHETGGHGNALLTQNEGELDRLVKVLVDALSDAP